MSRGRFLWVLSSKILPKIVAAHSYQGCHFGRAVLGKRFWAVQYKFFLGSFGHPPFGGRNKGKGVKKEGGLAYFLGDILILK